MKRMDYLKLQISFYKQNEKMLTEEDRMKLTELEEELAKSKKGKSAKIKGANYERKLAKFFKAKWSIDLVRTPQSGGFAKNSTKADDFRGDIVCLDESIDLKLHIEAKDHKTWKLKEWFKQADSDCPRGKIPCVAFHQLRTTEDGKEVSKSEHFIMLRLEDFLDIVDLEKVITRK